MMPILVAQKDFGSVYAPVNAYVGVVPSYGRLSLGVVIAVALVLKYGLLGQHGKTVCKAARHPQLAHIVFGELHGYVVSEGGAAAPYVHGHIEDAATDNTHQLSLCRRSALEMQAADNAAMRFALIILYETDVLAHGGFEDVVAICLGEVATSITYGLGLDDDDIRDGGAVCFDGCHYACMELCVK